MLYPLRIAKKVLWNLRAEPTPDKNIFDTALEAVNISDRLDRLLHMESAIFFLEFIALDTRQVNYVQNSEVYSHHQRPNRPHCVQNIF